MAVSYIPEHIGTQDYALIEAFWGTTPSPFASAYQRPEMFGGEPGFRDVWTAGDPTAEDKANGVFARYDNFEIIEALLEQAISTEMDLASNGEMTFEEQDIDHIALRDFVRDFGQNQPELTYSTVWKADGSDFSRQTYNTLRLVCVNAARRVADALSAIY